MFLEFDVDESGGLDFCEVLSLLSRFISNSGAEECIRSAFIWFLSPHIATTARDCNDKKWISGKDFRYLMTHVGDKLTDDEVDYYLIKYAYEDPAEKKKKEEKEFARKILEFYQKYV